MKEDKHIMGITNVVILGSTGSIGKQALEVINKHQHRFRVVGIAARDKISLLEEQVKMYNPLKVAITDPEAYQELKSKIAGKCQVLSGIDGLCELSSMPEADTILVAVSGAVGIKPTITAIEAGKRVALANKETLVAAGDIVMKMARDKNTTLIPVDSEHSAIYQCLQGERNYLKKVWLTASGGPFRDFTCEKLNKVTVDMALKHPNWSMGPKVTIDSASLMNKGLEVIEAHHLFAVDYDQIEVLVHRESVIHSMIELVDGSFLAHLGAADMRIPIQYALTWPERLDSPAVNLDFASLGKMHFAKVDNTRFPSLNLAYIAGRAGGTMPVVLNAANEIAVSCFLHKKIKFTDIPVLIERTMNSHSIIKKPDLDIIFQVDSWAREKCLSMVNLL
ncbi:MAG: 1-deoxy-D-xylulose-5-phosphate reductoisomerase [Syntrophomonadaceae bacterium]